MKRYPNGAEGEFFFQKRVPNSRPDWLQTVTVAFPSGRTATELCPVDVAHLIWAVNLGCLDLNPWPVRRWDVHHPDELRVDLDPQPGVGFSAVRTVAMHVRDVLAEHGMQGYPKTSGSRGIHVNVRIVASWGFDDVRRAALALAREVERRIPEIATSKWWKEERGERVSSTTTRTRVTALSRRRTRVRANRSSPGVVPDHLGRGARRRAAGLQPRDRPGALTRLWVIRVRASTSRRSRWSRCSSSLSAIEREGLGDAPWPPHFKKQPGEARRVAPSRKADRPDDG